MPTINKRFLFKLALALLVFAGLLTGAHALQAQRIPDALRRQAERAADAGKTDAAIHYLRQYLEFQPDDVDAMMKLADLLRLRGSGPRGQSELLFLQDRILRADPERHGVRREALALCLKLGRNSDAVTHGELLLKVTPDDAALWLQIGVAHAGLNQRQEARTCFEKSIALAPSVMVGYQRLAQLLWKNLDDAAGAKAVLDRMVAALPQEPEAYIIRARFENFLADESARGGAVPGSTDAALRDLRRVLELDPENADASLMIAETLQKGRDIPAAHAILRDAASLYPKDLRLVRSLAWLELVRGNVPASIAVLEEALKHSPEGFDLLVPLADLLVQQGDTARTQQIIKKLGDSKAPTGQVKYLEARLAMRQAKWAEAVQLLEALRGDAVKLPGLEVQLNLLLAGCLERTADLEAAEKAYKRVANADATNVTAHLGLATLYLNQGKFDDAVREYEVAARSPFAAGGVHAQLLRMKARRLRQAGGPAEEWARLDAAAIALAPRFGPVSAEPVILRAELLGMQGKRAEAVQLLRQEVARRPGDTRLWAVLADAAAAAAGTPAGLAVMDEAQAAAGDGPEVRLARATLYAREPGRARPIDPLTERIETWAEADQLRVLYGLVEIYDECGDGPAVVRTLRRIALHRPTDVDIWTRLHERATAIRDERTATEARAALVKIEGESGPTVVIRDAAAGTDPKAMDRLLAAFGPSPNRPDACLVLAKFKATTGDAAEAARLMERAFRLDPTRYETARAWLTAAGPNGVARLGTDSRWAGEPFRRMVGGAIGSMPPDAAATVLAACRPFVTSDPGGLGWLGTAYAKIGRPAESETVLVAATQSPGSTSDDWFRLALHHASSGRRDAALASARTKLAPAAFFALTAAYAETPAGKDWSPAVGDPAEKRLFAQSRLAVKLSRADSPGATMMLETFTTDKELRPTDIAWGRRNLAMLYALGGKPGDRKKAMELVTEGLDPGTTPEELRATASVLTTLARYLETEDRKAVLSRAIDSLTAAHKVSASARDLYNLAQLHRAAGNGKSSRDCLNELLKSDPSNIYYLCAGLEELIDKNDLASADNFAMRLRQLYAGEFRGVASVARYECKAGRPERALALADGYAAAADAGAGDHLTRSARVAELLDELVRLPNVRGTPTGRKMTDAAVERYAALVPTRAEAVVAIAGILAADGRVPEAFARIEQYDHYLPKRLRALAGLAALRSGGASDRQFDVVRGWLDDSLREDTASVPLRLNLAEYLALRQDVRAAAGAYEAILRTDPRNVIALNNLAWLLAADPRTAERALELLDRATHEAGLSGDLLDTRARVRITLKQFDRAERDLTDALTQDPTALRWFHVAVLKREQNPPQPDAAAKAFHEATARGLDPKGIHPADLPAYRLLNQLEKPPGK